MLLAPGVRRQSCKLASAKANQETWSSWYQIRYEFQGKPQLTARPDLYGRFTLQVAASTREYWMQTRRQNYLPLDGASRTPKLPCQNRWEKRDDSLLRLFEAREGPFSIVVCSAYKSARSSSILFDLEVSSCVHISWTRSVSPGCSLLHVAGWRSCTRRIESPLHRVAESVELKR